MNVFSLVRKSLAALAAASLVVAASPASAAPKADPVSLVVTITAGSSANGIIPGNPGGSPNACYDYNNVVAGGSLNDTIPLTLCVTSLSDDGTLPSWTVDVNIGTDNPAGNLDLPDPSPSPVSFSKGDGVGTCKSTTIYVLTGPLADLGGGYDYVKNIKIGADNPSKDVSFNLDGALHIKVRVAVDPPAGPSCFATDSDFNYLFACDGTTAVTSGSDGRFAIVANRKNIEVATNPGQFYYNEIWTNSTGADVTLNINFVRSGVLAKGAQAIHAGVFPAPFSGVDLAGFNAVNDAIPGGKADSMSGVVVPAGWTLWVTYHLEWAGLGYLVPAGASNSCSTANQAWTVSGTLTTSGGQAIGTCIAGGKGYVKK
jgi:hypothetical protein